MTTLILTGWQQPADTLLSLAPGSAAFDYSAVRSMNAFFPAMQKAAHGCDTLIGWSLGGQLALRAIASDVVRPRRLVLLSTPWQFIASPTCPQAMPSADFVAFQESYVRDPIKTLKRFSGLMTLGDNKAKKLHQSMNINQQSIWKEGLFWLDELERYSCDELPAAGTWLEDTRILILHGGKDTVVNPAQATIIREKLHVAAQCIIWPTCGHMPHYHDPQLLAQTIADFLT